MFYVSLPQSDAEYGAASANGTVTDARIKQCAEHRRCPMKDRARMSAKAGVTLIELLVVVLIIVILAVAMLPVLTPFVTRAKYAADGIPQVGNMRTKVQLYMTENEYMPGLDRTLDGTVLREASGSNEYVLAYGNSTLLADDVPPQTNEPPESVARFGQCMAQNGDQFSQTLGLAPPGVRTTWDNIWDPVTVNQFVNHYATDLDISDADLIGNNCGPENFVYACPVGKYKGNKYLYIVAVLGNGDKIPSGTGYAVLECYNPNNENNKKVVATWKRWKGEYADKACQSDQLCLAYIGGGGGVTGGVTKPDLTTEDGKQQMANNIFIPLALASDDETEALAAMGVLREMGWDL